MIQPIGNRLLIEPVKEETTTSGGLYIKDPDTLSTTKCRIKGLGTSTDPKLWEVGLDVLVPKQAFIEAKENVLDKTVIISEEDVIAVLAPDQSL